MSLATEIIADLSPATGPEPERALSRRRLSWKWRRDESHSEGMDLRGLVLLRLLGLLGLLVVFPDSGDPVTALLKATIAVLGIVAE